MIDFEFCIPPVGRSLFFSFEIVQLTELVFITNSIPCKVLYFLFFREKVWRLYSEQISPFARIYYHEHTHNTYNLDY